MRRNRITFLIFAIASATMPLVTIATCDPSGGTLNFYRNDDRNSWGHDRYYEDVVYYDDPYYYDDVYYDDYYSYCDFCF